VLREQIEKFEAIVAQDCQQRPSRSQVVKTTAGDEVHIEISQL
jgi:hypothetical protein